MNSSRLKEILTRGLILTTITGTLVCTGPNIISDNTTKVYALSSFETSKTKMINKLEKLYSKYNKKYYEEKDYTTLTSYYNSGIKKLKSLSEKNSSSKEVEKVYKEYEEKMNKIKPTILVSYQKSQEKKVLKKYKSLIKSNGYSKNNSEELEVIKNTSIEKIYKTKTKTKAKNIRIESINSLDSVKTLLEEEKEDVIYYINTNKNISESDKKAIIERINSANDIKVVESIGKEYNYEKNEKVTIKDIEDRIKSLCKKYKAYTEDEIRCLVATANLDYIDDSELFSVYKVNNFEGLKSKMLKADELLGKAGYSLMVEYGIRYSDDWKEISKIKYEKGKAIKYDDVFWVNDLIIRDDIRIHADYLCKLLKSIVEEDCTWEDVNTKSLSITRKTKGMNSLYKLSTWFYDYSYEELSSSEWWLSCYYDTSLAINVNDKRLKGSEGYVLDKFIYTAISYGLGTMDYRADCFDKSDDTFSYTCAMNIENNKYLSNKIDEIENNKKLVKYAR